jgi:hypothetical protein
MPKGIRGSGTPRTKRTELDRLLAKQKKITEQINEIRNRQADALVGRVLRAHAQSDGSFRETMTRVLDEALTEPSERELVGLPAGDATTATTPP